MDTVAAHVFVRCWTTTAELPGWTAPSGLSDSSCKSCRTAALARVLRCCCMSHLVMAPVCHRLTASLVYAALFRGSGSSMTLSAAATRVSPGCGPAIAGYLLWLLLSRRLFMEFTCCWFLSLSKAAKAAGEPQTATAAARWKQTVQRGVLMCACCTGEFVCVCLWQLTVRNPVQTSCFWRSVDLATSMRIEHDVLLIADNDSCNAMSAF